MKKTTVLELLQQVLNDKIETSNGVVAIQPDQKHLVVSGLIDVLYRMQHPEKESPAPSAHEVRTGTSADPHPIQPVYLDELGLHRFKMNNIVNDLLNLATEAQLCDLAKIMVKPYSTDDRRQFAQLIGYSVGGYNDLPYAKDAKVIVQE